MINTLYNDDDDFNALAPKKVASDQIDDDKNISENDYITVIDSKRKNIRDGEKISKEVSNSKEAGTSVEADQSHINGTEGTYEEVETHLRTKQIKQPDVSYIHIEEQIYEEVDNYLTAFDLQQTEPGYTALNVYHTEAQYTKINLNVTKSDQIKLVTNGTSPTLPPRRFGRRNETVTHPSKGIGASTDTPHLTQIQALTTQFRRCIIFGVIALVLILVLVAIFSVIIIQGKVLSRSFNLTL